MSAGRLGEDGRFVRQLPDVGHLVHEDLTDLIPVAVDGGNEDVAGFVLAELNDELGQIRLERIDAFGLEVLVEPDLLGGHRLDLDDLTTTGLEHRRIVLDELGDDGIGLIGVAGPVDDAAGGGECLFELCKVFGQVRHHVVLRGLTGVAQGFPVVELGDDLGALGPDRRGGMPDVVAQLLVAQMFVRDLGKGLGFDDVALPAGQTAASLRRQQRHSQEGHRRLPPLTSAPSLGARSGSSCVDARIRARWTAA